MATGHPHKQTKNQTAWFTSLRVYSSGDLYTGSYFVSNMWFERIVAFQLYYQWISMFAESGKGELLNWLSDSAQHKDVEK